jgi:hypothetical protein
MYYDHEFVGNQDEPCQELILRHNPDFQHHIEDWVCTRCNNPVQKITTHRTSDGEPDGWVEKCGCDWTKLPQGDYLANYWVCPIDRKPTNDLIHQTRIEKPCGLSWTSVQHPPDQFRHWCSALEAGGDCMHFEF